MPDLITTANAAQRALVALRAPQPTATLSAYHQVLWTLTLHMLQGFHPAFFHQQQLHTDFMVALDQLAAIPTDITIDLDFDTVMTRLDAVYLRHYHRLDTGTLNKSALTAYIQQLHADDYLVQAWLLAALAEKVGQPVDYKIDPQDIQQGDLLHYLYWLTHQFLLVTDYLWQSISPLRWLALTSQIRQFTPWVIAQQHTDIAAEMILCLSLAREQRSAEYLALLDLLLTQQTATGTIIDPQLASPTHTLHSTASGLLALVSFGR
jgi:hypothetical protein